MAGSSLLALLDDIATVLDDVAILSKVAAKKTAGVLGDDLALNAEQVADIRAERELPVVWAVAKGSFKNKLILVPAALIISVVAPWLITPLLMLGGAYLCFEGFEKVFHYFSHNKVEKKQEHKEMIKEQSKSLWAMALVMAGEGKQLTGLFRILMTRARTCELFALSQKYENPESYFVVGLFSGIDAVMMADKEWLITQLGFIDEINDALLFEKGKKGKVLKNVIALEHADWSQTNQMSYPEQIDLFETHEEAINWAHQLCSMI